MKYLTAPYSVILMKVSIIFCYITVC